jgi:hypothetical protein
VLFCLLALLVLGAALADRRQWPSFMGDEATYLMQAESLAFDRDFTYTTEDFERFVGHWDQKPQGLILQSGDGGATITFGKPLFYGLFLAPFVGLDPLRGPFLANALLLAFTSLFVARRMARRWGEASPLWVALLVFGSVTFAFTFWAHADLFLLCLTAIALALAVEPGEADGWWRWPVVGAFLAMVVFSRPLYAPLLPAALVAVPAPRRRPVAGLLIAAFGVVALTASVHQYLTGSFTGYGALRSGFYEHTGYPGVDFPVDEWTRSVQDELGNSAARGLSQVLRERPLSPALLFWNGVYFLFGRHVGLLPYFFPLVLLLFVSWRRPLAWALLGAVLFGVVLFLWSRPFNFYGGGGTLANRYFLPLYPALWFLPGGRLKVRPLLVIGCIAAVFMAPLWLRPHGFPIQRNGTYAYVAPAAHLLLPFETSQQHLRLAGREDLYNGFYLRLLSPDLGQRRDGQLRLPPKVDGEMLLGSAEPLGSLELVVSSPPRVRPVAEGATVEAVAPGRFRLELDGAEARHPMWWAWRTIYLYRLDLRFEDTGAERVVFTLEPWPDPIAEESPSR